LNNDINQNREVNKSQENVQSQQFYPGGGSQFPPRRPEMNNQQRGPQQNVPPRAPGMGDMPRTAPPTFIPEAPNMERGQMGGPGGPGRSGQSQFGFPFRQERQVGPRELRGCMNRFTYIWLVNGNAFWFFPTFVDRQFVQGFRWRRDRWEFDRINTRRILFFRCF
jgi:hypothetical protein